VIYSIGHSNHPLTRFVDLLEVAGIEVLFDVRRQPRSRWPQFSKRSLETSLPVDYVWLGRELGGLRDDGYADWMRTEDFERGIAHLVGEARIAAFMCSEGLPWKCHRRFIARALADRGAEVGHLLPDGTVVPEDAQLALPDL
jgi:uncharacterized protein (DUF488 family)